MTTLFIFKNFFINCVYLYLNEYSVIVKLKIFFTYLKLTVTLLTIADLLRLKKTTVLGYKVDAFNYRTLQYLFGEIFVRNEYFFKSKLKKPIIIDCGSNLGMSVIFFKFLFPQAIIHAFEPDPITFHLLEKNIRNNNLSDVYLHNEAVSDKEGELTFYTDTIPGSLLMSLVKNRISGKEIKVQTISLADFIKNMKVNFFKIDIEGHEDVVIKDMANKKVLSKFDEMVIEYHHNIPNHASRFAEFISFLERSGFKYQIDASIIPVYSQRFQDILVRAYKKNES